VKDVARIHRTPEDLDTLIDGYLLDDGFPERVMDLYSEVYLTQGEQYSVPFSAFDFDESINNADYVRSIGDEPLRILATLLRMTSLTQTSSPPTGPCTTMC
jgi:hypothetical protein